MSARIIAGVLMLFLACVTLSAQRSADFSGRWIAVSPGYTGREVRITTTRTTMKVTQTLNRRTESAIYNLDGTPRQERGAAPGEERWLVAAWQNGSLLLTDTRLTDALEDRLTQSLSLDSAGRLILGITRTRRDIRSSGPASAAPPPSKTVIVLKKR